jgi:hypothetical protein
MYPGACALLSLGSANKTEQEHMVWPVNGSEKPAHCLTLAKALKQTIILPIAAHMVTKQTQSEKDRLCFAGAVALAPNSMQWQASR